MMDYWQQNVPPRNIEKLKQEICAIFHSHGFKLTIDANRKQVNFLDITLNLENENFKPYIKPGDFPPLCEL